MRVVTEEASNPDVYAAHRFEYAKNGRAVSYTLGETWNKVTGGPSFAKAKGGVAMIAYTQESNSQMNDGRKPFEMDAIRECLICGYSLQGLPSSHRCPECGSRYEPGISIFQAAWRFQVGLALFCNGSVLAYIVLRGLLSNSWPSIESIGLVTATVCCVISIVGTWCIWERRNLRFVLRSDGFVVTDLAQELFGYRWDDIESISWSSVSGSVLMRTNRGTERLPGREFFGSHKRARDFVQLVNRRLSKKEDA